LSIESTDTGTTVKVILPHASASAVIPEELSKEPDTDIPTPKQTKAEYAILR
jgi:hypothetical protein